jgi:hypothetical protein
MTERMTVCMSVNITDLTYISICIQRYVIRDM